MVDTNNYIVTVTNENRVYLNGNIELVTSVEAANMLSLSRARISQLITDGRIRGYKLKALLLVPVDDLVAYMNSKEG